VHLAVVVPVGGDLVAVEVDQPPSPGARWATERAVRRRTWSTTKRLATFAFSLTKSCTASRDGLMRVAS
jgi:hypothetical protein